MKNLVLGNSHDNLKLAVIKTGSNRLIKQAKKQQDFFIQNNIDNISTPIIYNINDNNIIMEYIDGYNFINYLLNNNTKNIFTKLFTSLLDYVQDNINKQKRCDIEIFHGCVIDKIKLLDIEYKIKNKLIEKTLEIETTYTGVCHGDLTLANTIIYNDKLYLLDFLPVFFETPIQDIIKLRQDTKYLWSLSLLYNFQDYPPKILETLEKLDNTLVDKFKSIIDSDIYQILEIINYYRIIPYAKNQQTINYANDIIIQLCKNIL
jgi:hypothetical protein